MNDLDRKIQAALSGSPAGESLADEPNLTDELIATFHGRHRWLHGMAFVWTFVFFGIAVWAGFRFYHAEPLREQLLWGGLALLFVLFVAFLKLYFWLEVYINRVLREVKRVELLLVAQLPESPGKSGKG